MPIARIILYLSLPLITACAAHEPVEKVAVNQMGDTQMTCTQLRSEIGHMDTVVAAANDELSSASMGTTAATVGTQAAGVLGSMVGIPYIGLAGSSAPGLATAQAASQADATQARTAATQRKDVLVQLFNKKSCTINY